MSVFSISACGKTYTYIGDNQNLNINELNDNLPENGSIETAVETSIVSMDVSDMFSKKDKKTDYDESECTRINLGTSISIDGEGASLTDDGVLISEKGDYILSGECTDTKIYISAAADDKVRLILAGAKISNEKGAAIYAYSADKVFITLAEGTQNSVTGVSETISEDESTDAAIFSKTDLTINGEGTLNVTSSDGKGIVSRDDLKIVSGDINVDSSDHALSGKDSVRIAGGTLILKSDEDGIHSGNDEDEDKGYVYIENGKITIDVKDDGIHGETKVLIADGTINIVKSQEGIEGKIVEIAGGNIDVEASDDGINAADGSGLNEFGGFGGFGGGNMPGGFEFKPGENGNMPDFKNGEMPDFGNGKTPPEMPDFPNGQMQNHGSESSNEAEIDLTQPVYILISGGNVNINSYGDGIDANGSLYITGGNTTVSGPENNGNGAIDYDINGVVTGGTLIASGSSGMAMNFNATTQGSILVTFSSSHSEGEEIVVKDSDSNVIVSYTPLSKYVSVTVTSPDIKEGETYTISAGGETQTVTMDSLIYGSSFMMGGRPF